MRNLVAPTFINYKLNTNPKVFSTLKLNFWYKMVFNLTQKVQKYLVQEKEIIKIVFQLVTNLCKKMGFKALSWDNVDSELTIGQLNLVKLVV